MQTVTQEQAMNHLPIERELSIPGVNWVHGVTHDGHRVWIAADDGNLISIDPETGAVLSRREHVGCKAGLAFDGEALWAICGDEIRRIAPETGEVLASIPSPVPGDISGMAYAEGFLWVGQYSGKQVLKLDPKTGKVLRRVQRDRLVTGVSFVDGDVWYGSVSGKSAEPGGMLHQLDAATMEEKERFPYGETTFISGLEIDPNKRQFWAGGAATGKLRVLTRPRAR